MTGLLPAPHRPIHWPVGSYMATFAKWLALTLALAALAACRGGDVADGTSGGELVASLRSEPDHYNRYFSPRAAPDLVALLTHARLVRVDRATDQVEPALAERWETDEAGETVTLHLRRDVRFSDGTPFTADDVLFSLQVAEEAPGSTLRQALRVGGRPLAASAPDAHTVVLGFPSPYAPGVRILDGLPILPRHRLQEAFAAGSIHEAWTPGQPLSDLTGLGPFILTEHVAGQRLVFERNPHYWRHDDEGVRLPYLDRLRVEIVPEQNAEALRLESGDTDLMSNGDIRPDDHARFRRLADAGRLRLVDGGVGLDPNVLWFNLARGSGAGQRAWLHARAFRQALAFAADRHAIAAAVYLGAAVPIYGPITPRNATWYSADVPAYPHDPARARELLASIGLSDRTGDGLLEDPSGRPVRFSVLVQQGVTIRERTVAVLQEQFRRVGVLLDVVPVDEPGLRQRWVTGDYDSMFHQFQASATDPGMSLDFWLSSGNSHVWNPAQPKPATDWERRIDELMQRQVAARDLAERRRLFAEVQTIFGEELPALYFVAPRVTLALSPRVANARPAPQIPQILWSADTLAVAPGGRGR
jgi:peptide/nickel transport system substrate-binding protein